MKRNNWVKDNIKIDKDTKLIIGLGDSFCAGTGTESLETWNRNKWDVNQMRQDGLGFWESYDNSFINVLKTKYLNDFTSINLGMGGRGNRFAIRELFCNPQLNLESAKEKIVIFVSSGFERIDFSKDIIDIHEHTNTIWPFHLDCDDIGYGSITKMGESIYSEKLIVGEFIMDMYMLISWCSINNAKLLFISGFTPMLNREKLINILLDNRNVNNTNKSVLKYMINNACQIVNKIPWHLQIKPLGYETIIDLMLHKQGREDLIGNFNFRNYLVDKHTEDDYVSKCQHPTKKGHELIADIVYDYILNYDNLIPIDFTDIDKEIFHKKNDNINKII